MKTHITTTPDETMALAFGLAKTLAPGSFVALSGELGAGKTVFVKGLAKGLGVNEHEYVNSPTFVIMKEYTGRMPLYHFDVYRLDETHFADTVEYEKYFYGKGVTVVEWAERIVGLLPEKRIEITIEHVSEHCRRVTIR
ncbi:MAG: tRNA (adenosine(37)-N6)-threonylcarbamoyltransferase complex ATPase subunit type 1 TsaE [Candidatus Omnitrophica bacterium]|nr:tRNA (adenosine(37)-N6)-threonylcarbamoyltransferase complex ATPase subunit type 1 TsaE [Candidatus Omnitrophota bacterium]